MKARKKGLDARWIFGLYLATVSVMNCVKLCKGTQTKPQDREMEEWEEAPHLEWPPMKIFVYPKSKYHTSDCLHPKNNPNQYTNETNYWFQRMLEPTVHRQFLLSPIVTTNPAEADMFFVPHYSRMCSGLDGGERWNKIPEYCRASGPYLPRYSNVDHIIMHSVPHYGDKPADDAVATDRAPVICLLDFKTSRLKRSPWTFAKSQLVPFITIKAKGSLSKKRGLSAFVAMSTSSKGLSGGAANVRQEIELQLGSVKDSRVITIVRNNYSSFKNAIVNLESMMRNAELCVVPPGDAPSSKRFFDAINCLCVPYLLADYFLLPYEDVPVEYDRAIFQLSSRRLFEMGTSVSNLMSDLGSVWQKRVELRKVKRLFTWNYKLAPKSGEALWLLSWALYDKHRMTSPYLNNEMTGFADDPPFQFVRKD